MKFKLILAQILGIDKGFKLKDRKDLKKEGEIYFEVEYSKKIEIPECPYKCKGCKDKREYVVRNGKAKERIIKAGKVGTQRIYLIHRPQRYMCKKTGKSFRNEKISYRWQKITEAALDMRVSFKNAVKEELPGVESSSGPFSCSKRRTEKAKRKYKDRGRGNE
ncbi:hypothetical protein AA80_09780 [Petrotoga sibirica DSM 13575]|uniref:Transposase IS204/IS1001/IS1096/IS1165 zinc-finger domain-containing protein n=1 Tax=Petrotoga sibirica DSM 13575 TaxID=1122956 RepID=A0A855MMZ2_9BACT|nr:hypothetical protein AA80_09780 [Petrotoga sibirica DSM 13575]POZ90436.1 hypothetical protein AD60_07115 [Petrotoga sp. SL27]